MLDARKNKVYACLYKSDGKTIRRVSKYLLLSVVDLLKKAKAMRYNVLFLGDAIGQIFAGDIVRRKDWHPRADTAARLGAEYYRDKKFIKAEDLEPLYLYSRECDITGK